jgi:hypothetical protein
MMACAYTTSHSVVFQVMALMKNAYPIPDRNGIVSPGLRFPKSIEESIYKALSE